LFAHLTPRIFARAPFRVAVSLATACAILGAGGFMALPNPTGPAPVTESVVAPVPIVSVASVSRPVVARPADLNCLAKAVYYEARGESPDGQAAVAQVVLNRTRRPSYPSTVCAVVFQGVNQGGCQFSFVCDGAMHRPLEPVAWSRARKVASSALGGHVMSAVGQALSFHVASLGSPRGEIVRIGSHVFFMPGKARGSSAPRALRIASAPREVPVQATAATVEARDAAAVVPEVVAAISEAGPTLRLR